MCVSCVCSGDSFLNTCNFVIPDAHHPYSNHPAMHGSDTFVQRATEHFHYDPPGSPPNQASPGLPVPETVVPIHVPLNQIEIDWWSKHASSFFCNILERFWNPSYWKLNILHPQVITNHLQQPSLTLFFTTIDHLTLLWLSDDLWGQPVRHCHTCSHSRLMLQKHAKQSEIFLHKSGDWYAFFQDKEPMPRQLVL